jgi:hypothetical protein
MTAAQKIAKEKFKKAIAIRQKTGVSLKEAFAEVYGKKKVGAVKKKSAKKVVKKAAPKKSAKKIVKKAAPKKAAKKVVQKTKPRYSATKHTNWETIPAHKRRVNGLPKKKKVSEKSILNKIHKVKDEVNSLDQLQHKHMVGAVNIYALYDLDKAIQKRNKYKEIINDTNKRLKEKDNQIPSIQKELKNSKKTFISLVKEQNIHIAQIKKHIK